MATSAWGIEAGTSSIKAVKLTHDGKGGVTLDDIAIIDLASYYVDGGDERTALVRGLAAFVADKGIKASDRIYVSLPSRNQISRVITLPPVGEGAIRETIAHEARGQIPIKLEEAVWDYHLIDSSDPGELLVNLYAVKRDVIDSLIALCRSAGLPVSGIQLAPLGIYNFVKFELDIEISESCVCVDIGADNTDLVIIDGEKTWLRTVPFAGNDVTKALMMRFKKLTPAQAEKLKRTAAQSKDASKIFEAMKPPLKEMVGEVYRCVGFYKNQNENAQLNKLVMMGNGSKLFNITKFFEQQLQYEVHRISELSNISPARSVDPSLVAANVQSLVVATGLALQAVDVPGMIATNLLPFELVKEEQLKKVRPMALVAGAMVFLAGLAVFLLSLGPKGDASLYEGELTKAQKDIEGRSNLLDEQLARDAALNAQVTTLNNVRRGDELAWLSYLFTREGIQAYCQENDVPFVWCMKKDFPQLEVPRPGFDDGAFITEITRSDFKHPQRPEPVENEEGLDDGLAPEPEAATMPWLRTVSVKSTANLAVVLPQGQDVAQDIRAKYKELEEFLQARADILFAQTLDESEFADTFGKEDFASSMRRLRALVVVEAPKLSGDEAEREEDDATDTPKPAPPKPRYTVSSVSDQVPKAAPALFMLYGGLSVNVLQPWTRAENMSFAYGTLVFEVASTSWPGLSEAQTSVVAEQ